MARLYMKIKLDNNFLQERINLKAKFQFTQLTPKSKRTNETDLDFTIEINQELHTITSPRKQINRRYFTKQKT